MQGGAAMKKVNKKRLVLLVVLGLTFIYILARKTYEANLKNAMYAYGMEQGISEDKIRKVELNYSWKNNCYEYNVYLTNTDDELYFNFAYVLPYGQLKTYATRRIDANNFLDRAYIEGSVVGLDDKLAKPLIEQSK